MGGITKDGLLRLIRNFEANTKLYEKMNYHQLKFTIRVIRDYCLGVLKEEDEK